MLSRITLLKNVGQYRHATPARLQFGQVTLIYGENTCGKTTLTDCLLSLETDDPTLISRRETIPKSGRPTVVFSFRPEGQGERPVRFQDGKWVDRLPADLALRVFDDGFYHRNVFTGRLPSRENKVALTTFILGDAGVRLARRIADLKAEKRDVRARMRDLDTQVFNHLANTPAFLSADVNLNESDLRVQIDEKQDAMAELKQRSANADRISSRPDILRVQPIAGAVQPLTRFNEVLAQSLESVHSEARDRLDKHLRPRTSQPAAAEAWLRTGLELNDSEDCLFCGRPLDGTVASLLHSYAEVFDSSFREHLSNVDAELAALLARIETPIGPAVLQTLQRNSEVVLHYPELATDDDFARELLEVGRMDALVKRCLEAVREAVGTAVGLAKALRTQKLHNPSLVLGPVPTDSLEAAVQDFARARENYNSATARIADRLVAFRADSQSGPLSLQVAALGREIRELQDKLLRFTHLGDSIQYAMSVVRDGELDHEIPAATAELELQQSTFLDQYFDRLNYYYRLFGSRDFKLSRVSSKRGKELTYALKVEFRDTPIAESSLDSVMSESDRRALAFAVFWAQVSGLDQNTMRNTVLVLDDHATSFDEHRLTAVHLEVARSATDFRQVVMLSHFRPAVRRFLEAHGRKLSPVVLELRRKERATDIRRADNNSFLLSPHARALADLSSWAFEGGTPRGPQQLRVFLEREFESRFALHLQRHAIGKTMFGERISALTDSSILDQAVANELDLWREVLNPYHHIWVEGSEEDQRHTAERLLDFIFDRLFPSAP